MNVQTVAAHQNTAQMGAVVFAILLGVSVVFFSGLAQAEVLHDAAHDVRHATGFPCH